MQVRHPVLHALCLVVAIVLGSLLLPAHAAAAVTPGTTQALVNVGQPIRESSTAVPIFGISATSNAAADRLLQIQVNFAGTGFSPGNAGDLLPLDTDPAVSGVALFEDTGATPGVLDAGDRGVFANSASWTIIPGTNTVTLTYTEPFPAVPAGGFVWILAIRTSHLSGTLNDGDQIIASIPMNGITFTGAPLVTQPSATVSASPLTVTLSSVTDLLAPGTWIAPSTVVGGVTSRSVLGIRILDGGIATNRGIDDLLDRVVVHIVDNSGTFAAAKVLAPNTNPALSGIGLYRDTNANGVWDAGDAPLILSSISTGCAGGGITSWCLFPNMEHIRDTAGAGFAYFVVVRAGTAMAGGGAPPTDDFSFMIQQADGLRVTGVHPSDQGASARFALEVDTTSSSLLGDNTPPCITPACGQPIDPRWNNPTSSPYLFPAGRTIFFGHGMGATSVAGQVQLSARDGQSGLGLATFGVASSLAGSPAPLPLSGAGINVNVFGNYLFNATSTGASSPVLVTVFDAVGNRASVLMFFILDAEAPLIVPAPGWASPGFPFFVDGAGVLWFPPFMTGTTTVGIFSNLFDPVSGLRNASATREPSLAGGPTYFSPTSWGAGVHAFFGWGVGYDFNAASTDASHPAQVFACDNVANCANLAYDYRLDAVPPSVSILGPLNGAVLSGTIVVSARASDAGSGLAPPPQVEVLGFTGFFDMVFNGAAWVFPIPTGLFPDGTYRIVVQAFDNVGNIGVAVVDVRFANGAPPIVSITSPPANAPLRGTVSIWAQVNAGGPVSAVQASFDGVTWFAMTSVGSGAYTFLWDTTRELDGAHTIWVRAVAGLTTTVSEAVTVDNAPPSLVVTYPSLYAYLRGTVTLAVTSSDGGVGFGASGGVWAQILPWAPIALAGGPPGWSASFATAGVPDGTYTLTFWATDALGNKASVSLTVTIGNTPPAVAFLAPAANALLSGIVEVGVSVSDGNGVVSVSLSAGTLKMPMASVGGGTYRASWDTSTAGSGAVSLTVAATDIGGLTTSAIQTVTVDNAPPSLTVTSPASYASLTGTVALAATSSDAGVGFGASGGVWAQILPWAPIALAGGPPGWSASFATASIPDGKYAMTFWSMDALGNKASVSLTVTIDNTPPAVAFLAPAANALLSGVAIVEVSTSDVGGIVSVGLSAGASSVAMGAVDGGIYRASWDTTSLGPGPATLTVVATDVVGLTTTKTIQVRVDNAGPTVSVVPPSTDRGAIVLKATVSDSPAGVASVVFLVDGKTYAGVSDGSGGYSVTIVTGPADNGAHSYEVFATDRLGNTAMATGTFNVNNPTDYVAATLSMAPFLIFLVLLAALLLAIVLIRRRKRPGMPEEATASPKPSEAMRREEGP